MEQLQDLAMKPLPKGDLVDSEEVIGEELFLYDESTETVHQLNNGAAVVWFLCDGTRKVSTIVQEITAAFELPEQEVLAQVQDAIAEFQELGLLES